MASSSVTDWCTLRLSPGGQAHVPRAIDVFDAAHDEFGAQLLAHGSRESRSLRESCGRCRSSAAGRGCACAECLLGALQHHQQVFAAENSGAGRSKAAATSRRMKWFLLPARQVAVALVGGGRLTSSSVSVRAFMDFSGGRQWADAGRIRAALRPWSATGGPRHVVEVVGRGHAGRNGRTRFDPVLDDQMPAAATLRVGAIGP